MEWTQKQQKKARGREIQTQEKHITHRQTTIVDNSKQHRMISEKIGSRYNTVVFLRLSLLLPSVNFIGKPFWVCRTRFFFFFYLSITITCTAETLLHEKTGQAGLVILGWRRRTLAKAQASGPPADADCLCKKTTNACTLRQWTYSPSEYITLVTCRMGRKREQKKYRRTRQKLLLFSARGQASLRST